MTFSLQFPHMTVTSPPPCAILKEIAELEHQRRRRVLNKRIGESEGTHEGYEKFC